MFTDMDLSRESSFRKSITWLEQQMCASSTLFIPNWEGDYYFVNQGVVSLSYIELATIPLETLIEHSIFLGMEVNLANAESGKENKDSLQRAVFVINLSGIYQKHQATEFVQKWLDKCSKGTAQLTAFRSSLAWLEQTQAAILGYGRSLTIWHQSAKHCGFCGSKTKNVESGHSRVCLSTACDKATFPRTDPVVIMLVECKINGVYKCLLAGHHHTPDNLVTTLAGFVDPGETLEQAVQREVFEETGVEVDEVEYICSQPWPFPHSMMIGFFAKAKSNTISVDLDELRHANWFDAEQVASFSDWGEENSNMQIPKKLAISRNLIDLWLEKHLGY